MSLPPPEIFQACDSRGVVGKSLTPEGVRQIGQALGSELLERSSGSGRPEIAVGRDGRISGAELARALMEGIRASGVDVAEIGMFATPVAYFAAHELGCGSAVAVTGSHNPPEYNGLKMVLAGTTLAGEDVQRLRRRIESGELARGAGRHRRADILEAYLNRITSDVRLARRMSFRANPAPRSSTMSKARATSRPGSASTAACRASGRPVIRSSRRECESAARRSRAR